MGAQINSSNALSITKKGALNCKTTSLNEVKGKKTPGLIEEGSRKEASFTLGLKKEPEAVAYVFFIIYLSL